MLHDPVITGGSVILQVVSFKYLGFYVENVLEHSLIFACCKMSEASFF